MKGLLFASTVLMILTIGCNSGTSDKTAPATAARRAECAHDRQHSRGRFQEVANDDFLAGSAHTL